ncbi:hypothetical protein BASA50_005499 [Batrachochytrium salamandrivorans]|uniref:DUF4200 domain-containing protein n=1 Tax=Batrachochytrium salamandrivorans TaxID=1357716 RepID=A0ABQ8FD18_9FUNG|nr:hypothetical protein BASA50_005499 [Batrachochytrium salamandrivorans]
MMFTSTYPIVSATGTTTTTTSTEYESNNILEAEIPKELQQWACNMGYGIDQRPDSIGTTALDMEAAKILCKQQLNPMWREVSRIRRQLEWFKQHAHQAPHKYRHQLELFESISARSRDFTLNLSEAKSRNEALRARIHREEAEQRSFKQAIDETGFDIAQLRVSLVEKQRKLLLADAHAKRLLDDSALFQHYAQSLDNLMGDTPISSPEDEMEIISDVIKIMRASVSDIKHRPQHELLDNIKTRLATIDPGRLVSSLSLSVGQDAICGDSLFSSENNSRDLSTARLISNIAKLHAQRFVETINLEETNKQLEDNIEKSIILLREKASHFSPDRLNNAMKQALQSSESFSTSETVACAKLYSLEFESTVEKMSKCTGSSQVSLRNDYYRIQGELTQCYTMLEALISTMQDLQITSKEVLEKSAASLHHTAFSNKAQQTEKLSQNIVYSGVHAHEQVKEMSINHALASIRGSDFSAQEWAWLNNGLLLQIRKESNSRYHKSFRAVMDELKLCKIQTAAYEALLDCTLHFNDSAVTMHTAANSSISQCKDIQQATLQKYSAEILPIMDDSLLQAQQSQTIFHQMEGIVKECNWFTHERDDPFSSGSLLEPYLSRQYVSSPDIG